MATTLPGVRPIIRLASVPTARMLPVLVFTATTDGSLRTIPRPLTYTSVLAVPRSTAMSRPMNDMLFAMGMRGLPEVEVFGAAGRPHGSQVRTEGDDGPSAI